MKPSSHPFAPQVAPCPYPPGLERAEGTREGVRAAARRLQALETTAGERLPPRRFGRGKGRWFMASAILLAGGILGVGFWLNGGHQEDVLKGLEFQPARRGRLTLSIVEKGELEAVVNTEVVCRVRSSGRGLAIASTIKWVIEDGTQVQRGDVLMRLDDSGVREQIANQEISVAEKQEMLVRAENDEAIIDSQNRIDLQTAANNVRLAEISREKYQRGDLEQKRDDLMGRTTLAESDLQQWKDRVGYSARMVRKGYITGFQAQAEEARLQNAEIALRKLKEERRVLENYESRYMLLDLENRLEQAREMLRVAEIQAKSKKSQAAARVQAVLQVLRQEEAKLEALETDLRNCVITAPNKGMVVYTVPEHSRYGTGSQQNIIAVGEPVREGQHLMRIPDLSRMQARIKVHESLVPRLRGNVTRETGFSETLLACLAMRRPGFDHAASVITAPLIRDLYAERDQEVVEYGLPALVKTASSERPYNAHVEWVSAVNSANDYLSGDVKVYPAIVAIDEPVEGLKPGMSSEVTILLDELEDVLQLPVHAVLKAGPNRFCYVRAGLGVEKRRLITGMSNNRFIEIKEGSEIAAGDEVVANPRSLAERLGDLKADYEDPGLKLRKAKPAASR